MLTRIRLTLKQHRFETLAIAVVCVGLAVAALIEAYRLNSLGVPISCFSSGQYYGTGPFSITSPADAHCQALANSFDHLQRGVDMNIVLTGSGKLIEVQATAEGDPFDRADFDRLLDLAVSGCETISALQMQMAGEHARAED